MKILLISNSIDQRSGYGRYTHSITRKFLNKGVDFVVATNIAEKQSGPHHKPILFPLTSFVNFICNVLNIRSLLKKKEISAVHALDGWPYGVYGYLSVLGTRKKLFLGGVGTYSMIPQRPFIKNVLMRLMYKRARSVVCISNYVKDRILNLVPTANCEVVFLGSTKMPSADAETINRYKQKYNLENFSPALLSVGAIKHRKGQLNVVRALPELKKKYPNIRYIMVGSDEDSSYLEKINTYAKKREVEKNITIISDANTDKDLAALYELSDIFLLTSNNQGDHFEGFGLVFLEAGQFGKPGIGSSGCGIEDAIEDGYNGYLVKQGDAQDICDKIEKLLDADYERFSENAKEFQSRFSWDKTVNRYLEIYSQ